MISIDLHNLTLDEVIRLHADHDNELVRSLVYFFEAVVAECVSDNQFLEADISRLENDLEALEERVAELNSTLEPLTCFTTNGYSNVNNNVTFRQ